MPASEIVLPADSRPLSGGFDSLLMRDAPVRRLSRQEHLFFEGDPPHPRLYLVQSGIVMLYRVLGDGRRQVFSFRVAGETIGLDGRVQDFCSARAITPAAVRSIPLDAAHRRLHTEPEAREEFIAFLSAELAQYRAQIAILNRRSAVEKMSSLLIDLWLRMERKEAEAVRLPLGRLEMADFLGLTIETVSRTLTKLQNRSVINLPNCRQLMIIDRQRLQNLASGHCEDW